MGESEDLLLISFIDGLAPERGKGAEATAADLPRITELENELLATRNELRSAIHDLEISGEDQKTINEEALSVNEEFQAANEELLASKDNGGRR